MRDIVKDAAIVAIATRAMDPENGMSVKVFLDLYTSTEDERESMETALRILNLAWPKTFSDDWGFIARQWVWWNED